MENRIKYLCLLGHQKHPTSIGYSKWQRKIIKKYNLWAFSYITPEQIESEIKLLE